MAPAGTYDYRWWNATIPLIKDSVDVEAHMGAVEMAFTAAHPGDWFLHCHKPMHMEGGMIPLVSIA
jgi:FtsP/CotA-like multicopper oxidase with cupredoxin domain